MTRIAISFKKCWKAQDFGQNFVQIASQTTCSLQSNLPKCTKSHIDALAIFHQHIFLLWSQRFYWAKQKERGSFCQNHILPVCPTKFNRKQWYSWKRTVSTTWCSTPLRSRDSSTFKGSISWRVNSQNKIANQDLIVQYDDLKSEKCKRKMYNMFTSSDNLILEIPLYYKHVRLV